MRAPAFSYSTHTAAFEWGVVQIHVFLLWATASWGGKEEARDRAHLLSALFTSSPRYRLEVLSSDPSARSDPQPSPATLSRDNRPDAVSWASWSMAWLPERVSMYIKVASTKFYDQVRWLSRLDTYYVLSTTCYYTYLSVFSKRIPKFVLYLDLIF